MSNSCEHKLNHHSHDHHHGHHHFNLDSSSKNIAIAFALNASFALIEFVGGWMTQSVAIQADAIHDLGDSLALAAALGLQIWSRTSANDKFNFGFKRLSLLSAFGTSLLLLVGSFFIMGRAVDRLMNPISPHLNGMTALAVLGVIVNGVAAWKIGRGETQNERALSWHMIEDLLGWVAVLVGSIVMRFFEAAWLDPALSLVIAGVVVLGASRNFFSTLQLFLQAAPNLKIDELRAKLAALQHVIELVNLRIWSLDGAHHVVNVHIKISPDLISIDRMKLKESILEIFGSYGEFDATIEFDETSAMDASSQNFKKLDPQAKNSEGKPFFIKP